MKRSFIYCFWVTFCVAIAVPLNAQHHSHHTDHSVVRPRVYLDKAERIVQYQLGRLSNEQLLLVETSADDPLCRPVFDAILKREGMSQKHRVEALEALVSLNDSSVVAELLRALSTLDSTERGYQQTSRQLIRILLQTPAETLGKDSEQLTNALTAENKDVRSAAHASLMMCGRSNFAVSGESAANESATQDWLAAVAQIPESKLKVEMRPQVLGILDSSDDAATIRGAIATLAVIPSQRKDSFCKLSSYVRQDEYRSVAVRALSSISAGSYDVGFSAGLAEFFVTRAETLSPEKRTTDEFLAEMSLTDRLLSVLPQVQARDLRDRLREVTVRVVQIHTVEEEMRYNVPHFAVEAGQPVQVVLINDDLMPHNLVVTKTGKLKEVALAGAAWGAKPGFDGKPFVPDSENVLFATGMVQGGARERLTFEAPATPGEYPYVCTFPNHWMRMYGVMVVVNDLDAWLKTPTTPTDPVGSTRKFVKAWTPADFNDIAEGLRGRSTDIGHRIFREASCFQCHQLQKAGGKVGPDLTDVLTRWKGDHKAVVREVLDPSFHIDPKYAVHTVITAEGKILTGIIQAQDKSSLSILQNPEAKELTTIDREEIDDMSKSSTSMMPKALLNNFTKDEIYELLALLLTSQQTITSAELQ